MVDCLDQSDNFVQFRKPIGIIFGENNLTFCNNVEDPVASLDEFGFDANKTLDIGRQTGGPW